MASRGWIGVDLDGTLAHYDHFRGIEHVGAPIGPMVERVKNWLAAGQEVRIFTARVDGGEGALAMGDPNAEAHRDVDAIRRHIEQWCLKHIGRVLPITNRKDFGMIELWDDRAVQVIPNTGIAGDRAVCRRAAGAIRQAVNLHISNGPTTARWVVGPFEIIKVRPVLHFVPAPLS